MAAVNSIRHLGWVGAMLLAFLPISAIAAGTQEADLDGKVAQARVAIVTNPAAAYRIADAAEIAAKRLSDEQQPAVLASLQWVKAEALVRLGRVKDAEPLIRTALGTAIHMRPQTKLLGDLLITRGAARVSYGHVAQALEDYQAAFKAFGRSGVTRSQAIALLAIAELYWEAKDYQTTLKYFRQADDLYRGEPAFTVSILNNQAVLLKELGRCNLAIVRLDEAMRIAKKLDSSLLQMQILRNRARCQLLDGQVEQAHSSIAAGQRLVRQAGQPDDPMMLAVRAQAELQADDKTTARRLIDRAFAGIDPRTTTLPFREAHETAVAVYQAVGDSAAALVHLEALKRLDDQATKLATSTSTALMGARFDFANQELKIAKLRQDELARSVAFEQARARTQRYVFLGAAAATAIVIALLGFGLVTIRRSRNEVRAANDDLAVTNTALGKALAAKTEFLATTSHEIRTPLNGILGMAQVMLADRELDAPTRDRLTVVHGAGLTMRALVDDILDVAKMETGNLTIETAAFDLAATVSDATRLWETQAAAKGLRFARDLAACPAMIEGDAARVRQIVFNLLSNAVKFTPEGEVLLTVAAAGERYRIVVADTGIGIAADQHEAIFESFRQADTSTTRQFGGTGLGLSICRNLARAMGGDITVESVLGAGSTFTVDLPLVTVAEALEPAVATVAGPRLLIVDRNPIARSMMRTMLAPHAAEVEFASDVDAAVERVGAGDVTHLLLDDATMRASDDPVVAVRRIVEAASAAGTEATLLWPAADAEGLAAMVTTGVTRVVAKPVASAALAEAMFAANPSIASNPRLVPQAA